MSVFWKIVTLTESGAMFIFNLWAGNSTVIGSGKW